MIINQANIEAIFKAFNTIYQAAFGAYTPQWPTIAMEVPSATEEENYAWLSAIPKMREWLGERQYKNLLTSSYAIRNRDFEASVEVPRNKIQDDKLGIFNPLTAEVGRSAASHPDELVFELLGSGFTEKCYDGCAFFSDAHKVGKTTVSNIDVPESNPGNPWFLMDVSRAVKPLVFQNRQKPQFASLTDPNSEQVFKRKSFVFGVDSRDNAGFGLWQFAFGSKQPLTPANYEKARAALRAMKDPSGKLLQVRPGLLVVGGSNEGAGRKICYGENASTATGSESNPWKGTAELLVSDYLD